MITQIWSDLWLINLVSRVTFLTGVLMNLADTSLFPAGVETSGVVKKVAFDDMPLLERQPNETGKGRFFVP